VISQRSTSNHFTGSIDESKSGKRKRDSAFGHPRPDPVSPNRIEVDDPEGISYQPEFSDPDETTLKSLETGFFSVLTRHVVYPFMNPGDPTLRVKIMDKDVSMLLDTGAHVSVLPKRVVKPLAFEFPSEGQSNRHVKVFGGQEIVLDGPIDLDVTICGLQLVHPFF